MSYPKEFLQNISLIFGEITEQFFFRIREVISNTIQFTQKQLLEISDHPNFKETFLSNSFLDIQKSLSMIDHFSNESLLKILYYFSDFLHYITEYMHPFEPSLLDCLYTNIQKEVLLSDFVFREKNTTVCFRDQGKTLMPEQIIEELNQRKYNTIIVLLPPVLSDESIWESTQFMNSSLEEFFHKKGMYPIKLRLNPYQHIRENAKDLYFLLQKVIDSVPIKKWNFLAFGSGNLVLRSLLFQYHEFWESRSHKVIMVSSPDLGMKIERIMLWAGLGLQYDSLFSLKILKLSTQLDVHSLKDITYGKIMENEDHHREKELLAKYDLYRIYSLISEYNSIWSPWLGDGFIEENSLSYYDTIIPEDKIFIINGISHLQMIPSPEFRNILNSIWTSSVNEIIA